MADAPFSSVFLDEPAPADPDPAPAPQRLAPLPKRVAEGDGDGGALTAPPLEYVRELLERARVLLNTLDHDVSGLAEDEEEERLRIELEQQRRKQHAADAREQVEDFLARAYRIAQSKGKVPVLEQGLLQSRVAVDDTATYESVLAELEAELKAAKGITGAIRLGRIGELLQQANAVVKRLQDEADGLRERQMQEVEEERQAETKEATASFEIGTMILNRDLGILDANLPLAARPWSDEGWEQWEPPPTAAPYLRLGHHHDDALEAEIPLLLQFPFEQSLVLETLNRREEAIRGIQSLLVRLVAAVPPGAVRFTFIDPKGLGESVAPLLPLGEFDPELIDRTVVTTPEEIEERLNELGHHIERVIMQYLRGTYASLAECNEAAGEILEPYHVLVVLDHPNQLDEQTGQLLAAVADNGPRCGVFTIIAKDSQPSYSAYKVPQPERARVLKTEPAGYGVDVPEAGHWTVRLDELPAPTGDDGPSIVERIVTTAGRRAGEARESALEVGKLYDLVNRVVAKLPGSPGLPDLESAVDPGDPTTWWSASSATGLAAPLGRLGANAVAGFAVEAKRPSLLIAGQTASGVTNAVHATLMGLAMLYSPDELELHLLGMRGSRDFRIYAEHGLPHANVIAVDADRHFGLSLLKDLDEELERRLALLRDTVGERAGYEGHRDDPSVDEPLPRSLVVIDRFAELLTPEDRTSQRARDLLDKLARLGPTAGMHLLLVTSADVAPLAHPIVSMVRQRLVFALPEDAARLLVGDAAEEVAGLVRAGDALLASGADGAAAKRFQAVWVNPTEQAISLRDLQRLMDEHGAGRSPQVYDGGEVARLERRDPLRLVGDGTQQAARRIPRLWLGEPMGIGEPVETLLRRQDGANLLVVTGDPEVGQGLLLSSIVSALLVHGDHVGVLALDFMPPEAGFSEAAHALATGPWTMQLARRRSIVKVVDVIHRVVQDRLATEETRGKPVLFVLNGLGRARDLEVDGAGNAVDDDHHLLEIISAILRDGPEVGVHTLAWCDSLSALNRRLPKAAIREFALRVAGPMAAADSLAFIDSETASVLEPNEALFADEDWGKLQKLRPYAPPAIEWLEQLGDLARAASRP